MMEEDEVTAKKEIVYIDRFIDGNPYIENRIERAVEQRVEQRAEQIVKQRAEQIAEQGVAHGMQ